jgi:hypothetical protein
VGSRATQVGRWWARAARRAWRPSGVLGKRSQVGLAVVETRARSRWGLLTSMPAQSMVLLLWVD